MGMGGMEGMGGDCKISMLWNWNTIDACFLASSWHIRSNGMFAASCIGVALLTVCLEALRRLGREYDGLIARQWRAHAAAQSSIRARCCASSAGVCSPRGEEDKSLSNLTASTVESATLPTSITLRVTPIQQLIRALLHAATFGVAYIIMLLAMYFNGFIIISIIIGAGLGKFVCDWMVATLPLGGSNFTSSDNAQADAQRQGNLDEPTVCCG